MKKKDDSRIIFALIIATGVIGFGFIAGTLQQSNVLAPNYKPSPSCEELRLMSSEEAWRALNYSPSGVCWVWHPYEHSFIFGGFFSLPLSLIALRLIWKVPLRIED